MLSFKKIKILKIITKQNIKTISKKNHFILTGIYVKTLIDFVTMSLVQ
jgi:hypothetical protein